LRKIARVVGDIVNGFDHNAQMAPTIERALQVYSETLSDWAKSTAWRMLSDVSRRDEASWMENSVELSRALRDEIRNAPTGQVMRALLDEQVTLIKSLPLDAAKRVHQLTLTGIENSTRASEMQNEIRRSGEISANRAKLIARTEVARTASVLTQARAEHIGSEGYIWRTSEDSDVRESHKEMDGKYVRWDTPPKLSDGTVTHAGQIYNCRCYPEPVLPT